MQHTIIAVDFQQANGGIHQCAKKLSYQNERETFICHPKALQFRPPCPRSGWWLCWGYLGSLGSTMGKGSMF